MLITMNEPLFYHKKPSFGLDMGSQAIKVMQLTPRGKHAIVKAYGSVDTDAKIMKDGVVTNVQSAARLIDQLLADDLHGQLTTNRAVMSVPVSRVFTRVITMPHMSKKELADAVKLDVEQSVPVPAKKLYFDFETTDIDDPENQLVRIVAVPKDIVDSYVAVCDLLKLDLALVQTNIRADAQLLGLYEDIKSKDPYIILDVGGNSIDVGVFDTTLRVTGTVDEGGNSLTKAIAKKLKITEAKAHEAKVTHGIAASKQQEKIKEAVMPILDKAVKEVERMARFYEERVRPGVSVSQILIVGGGANMPGLGDYLTNATRIATRVSSPWGEHISFGKLEPPEAADLPRFLTCAGSAVATDYEVFE